LLAGILEAIFFLIIKLKVRHLQSKDPLEASLSAAPMFDPEDRKEVWERMVDAEKDDPISFITGWFFDQPIESISRYDVCDFICWAMFDGRNQEHLTSLELHELECFVEDVEYQISLQLYGLRDDKRVYVDRENVVGTINKENELTEPLTPNKMKRKRILSPRRIRKNSEDTFSSASDLSSTFSAYPLPNKSKY
jgi:hypothetical protein